MGVFDYEFYDDKILSQPFDEREDDTKIRCSRLNHVSDLYTKRQVDEEFELSEVRARVKSIDKISNKQPKNYIKSSVFTLD